MFLRDMKIGRPIEIYINRDGYNYRVVSKIEEVNETSVYVTLIASSKRVFQFDEGDIIDLVYRKDDRMWKWSGVTGDIKTLDDEQFHCFESNKEGEPYNRRNAYRVNINERIVLQHKIVEMAKLKNEGSLLEDCYRYEDCDAILKDISEVGVGFFSDVFLNIQDEISFHFMSDVGEIRCSAVIMRFYESRNHGLRYYYGCRFLETSRTLVKYIYDMQRHELQRAKEQIVRR